MSYLRNSLEVILTVLMAFLLSMIISVVRLVTEVSISVTFTNHLLYSGPICLVLSSVLCIKGMCVLLFLKRHL